MKKVYVGNVFMYIYIIKYVKIKKKGEKKVFLMKELEV